MFSVPPTYLHSLALFPAEYCLCPPRRVSVSSAERTRSDPPYLNERCLWQWWALPRPCCSWRTRTAGWCRTSDTWSCDPLLQSTHIPTGCLCSVSNVILALLMHDSFHPIIPSHPITSHPITSHPIITSLTLHCSHKVRIGLLCLVRVQMIQTFLHQHSYHTPSPFLLIFLHARFYPTSHLLSTLSPFFESTVQLHNSILQCG